MRPQSRCPQRMLLALLTASLVGSPSCATRLSTEHRHTGPGLEAALREAMEGFEGAAGVYVRHLDSGREVAIRADELFPTASMIKVPIMLTLFDRIERGEVDYKETLVWNRKRVYAGSDILASFQEGEKISIPKLVMLMQTMSDNTASLWLQELAGTGSRINEWLSSHGFTRTRMNSRTPGRTEDWKKYGWGQTSPREMAEFLILIRKARHFSPGAADEMYRNLTRSFWNDGALARIPPWIQVASKQGAVSQSRSEAFLVNAPHGDYVCCVITRDQADTSWTRNNAGATLIRHISGLLWRHFEPQSTWRPPAHEERW